MVSLNCNNNSFSISNPPPLPIFLGYPGENDTRPVSVDVSAWLEEFPDGTVSIVYTRADKRTYLVVVNDPGPVVTWKPNRPDLVTGSCRLQVQIQQGDDVKKDRIVDCVVGESLDDPNDPPEDPVPSYVEQVIDAADRAEAAADRAEEAAESIDEDAIEQAVSDYLDEHPIEAPVQSVNGQTGAVDLSADDVGALPADTPIPSAVTEQTVAGWGFTKNTGTYSKPSGGIPASDLASAVQTSLGKADTALQPDALQTELDDNVPPARFVLVRNGNTVSTVDTFIVISNLLFSTPRRVVFFIVASQSGGTVTSALELYPTMIDTKSRALTLVGFFDGNRYTAELTAASVSSTMTGTLVVEPIVAQSDIPTAVSELTNDSGYQTAQDVQTAISGVRQLPAVTASDNGKFLRVVSGAWAAATVPSAESNSFGGGA